MFLELLSGVVTDFARAEYRIELVHHANPNRNIRRQYISDFRAGECWGYMRCALCHARVCRALTPWRQVLPH